jgi:hypothetical protein
MKSIRFFMTAIIIIIVTVALTPSLAKADIHVYDKNDQCQVGAWSSEEYYPLTHVQMPFTTPFALPLSFKIEKRSESVIFPIVVAPKNQ